MMSCAGGGYGSDANADEEQDAAAPAAAMAAAADAANPNMDEHAGPSGTHALHLLLKIRMQCLTTHKLALAF